MIEKFCFYMYLTLYFFLKSNACLQEYFDTELIFNVSMQVKDNHHPCAPMLMSYTNEEVTFNHEDLYFKFNLSRN